MPQETDTSEPEDPEPELDFDVVLGEETPIGIGDQAVGTLLRAIDETSGNSQEDRRKAAEYVSNPKPEGDEIAKHFRIDEEGRLHLVGRAPARREEE